MKNFDDTPIKLPEDDRFSFNPFAAAIAEAIVNLESPTGSVIAINGAWGTGKSSIVNLVKHHINESKKSSDLTIVDFNCWWFRGEEALALEFFRELYSAVEITNSDKAKKAVSRLGSRLLSGSSSFVGAALNLAAPGIGSVAKDGMNLLSELIQQDGTVESFHKDVSEELEKGKKRFLIVIDDIDRLSPDEALLIFRLVKSVGKLPNVMYLMAYDREIAERVVSDRYPSEGPQYLEKIVQAGFDIPSPPHSDLVNNLTVFLNQLWADLPSPDIKHFWNLMHEVVSPEIRSPRDVLRIINTLGVSWSAVSGEVDPVDFLCMETLRVQRPQVYSALKANKERLTDGGIDRSLHNSDSTSGLYDELFLSDLTGENKEKVRKGLKRLFPALESAWGGPIYGPDFFRNWERQRRVCSKKHFDTYFRFALSNDNVSIEEVNAIIENCNDTNFVKNALREAKALPNKHGGTRVAKLLDELNVHAERIPLEKAAVFLAGVFAVHDEIAIEADEARGFAIANNTFRIHWLVRSILWDRTTLSERSQILVEAAEAASVGWISDLANSAYHDYNPKTDQLPEPEEKCLTTETDANLLRQMAISKIEEATTDKSLLNYDKLFDVLYSWGGLSGAYNNEHAREWCSQQMQYEGAVVRFAELLISSSWSQGIDDTISVKTDYVSRERIAVFFDQDAFKERVDEIFANNLDDQSSATYQSLKRFLDAWENESPSRR